MDNKIYVFDMDDTLVDSHLRYTRGILRVLDDAGVAYEAETLIPILNPLGFPRTADYYSAMGVPGSREEIVERLLDSMVEFYTTDVHLMPGTREYLLRLKAGGARLFVLTATPHRITDACLRVNRVYDLFEQVWCTDDFGHNKSEPALFRQVAEAIGCPPEEILFYDDGVTAIRTARSAGWQTCGFLAPYAVENGGMAEAAHTCIHSFEEYLR